MSKRRQSSGEDYPEAAQKHCEDARNLLARNRSDGAAYLADYAVECTLKSVIQIEENHNKPVIKWAHNLNTLGTAAMCLAALPTNKTARYFKNGAVTTLPYSKPPAGWTESLRYYPVGTILVSTATQWVGEAERLYLEVIGELQKDGEI